MKVAAYLTRQEVENIITTYCEINLNVTPDVVLIYADGITVEGEKINSLKVYREHLEEDAWFGYFVTSTYPCSFCCTGLVLPMPSMIEIYGRLYLDCSADILDTLIVNAILGTNEYGSKVSANIIYHKGECLYPLSKTLSDKMAWIDSMRDELILHVKRIQDGLYVYTCRLRGNIKEKVSEDYAIGSYHSNLHNCY